MDVYVVRIEPSQQVDTSAAPAAWVTVATPDHAFNLLYFQNGTTALAGRGGRDPPDHGSDQPG
jgi:chromosome condensin MukBEF ATPase and DNA-binding subunit MukB